MFDSGGVPRYFKDPAEKPGIFCPLTERQGSTSFPTDALSARLRHFVALALIPDQQSHCSTMYSSCWQADGELATRHVSSAYCRRFRDRLLVKWYPRSSLVLTVSTMVLMTVLNITTDRGSPWNTPIFSGIRGVVHWAEFILAERSV